MIQELKDIGYSIEIFFLWISHIELSLKRIRERVRLGGHDVPEKIVRRRYKKGLQNLFSLYQPLADSVTIVENSGSSPQLVAMGNSEKYEVINPELFEKIKKISSEKGKP